MAQLESPPRLQGAAAHRLGGNHIIKGSSHQQLCRAGYPDFIWAFHDSDEIGPKMLTRIAKKTGLTPQDL